MFERRKCKIKCLIWVTIVVFMFGVLFLSYFCPEQVCTLSPSQTQTPKLDSIPPSSLAGIRSEDLDRDFNFDPEADRNVLVFLHIQKTGGTTFGRYLVKNTDISEPCVCYKHRKRCDCRNSKNHIWLFSRYSTGWACGLHADWTELHDCVPKVLDDKEEEARVRRYLYFTVLRDPIQRYISEWKHVQRGSTWLSAKLMCNGRQASLDEVPFCFKGDDWTGVTLDEFMSCQHNLAHNRQTRMLANLSLIGCYNQNVIPNQAEREQLMLQSAKDNLRKMAFFGLTEYQADTRYLFERTFHIHFTKDFVQFSDTHASKVDLKEPERTRLLELNKLDIELYSFAKSLFLMRLDRARQKDGVPHLGDVITKQSEDSNPANRDSSFVPYKDGEYNYEGEVEDEEETDVKTKKAGNSAITKK